MTSTDSRQREGAFFILLSVLGYSFFPVWVAQVSDAGMTGIDIATWRFLIAVPLLWLIVTLRRRQGEGAMPRVALLLTGMLMTVAAVSAVYGLQLIPASIFILLFYTYPAMVTVIAVIRGERIERAAWVALVMTLVGAALTTPDMGEGTSGGTNLLGVVLALVNAFIVALYYLATSHLMRGVRDTPRASAYVLSGALVPLAVLLLVRTMAAPPSPGSWGGMIGLAAVSTVLPIVCLSAGIQRLGAPRAAILSTLEPVLTLIWSVLLLGDVLRPVQLLGGGLIFVSIVLLQLRQLRSLRRGQAVAAEQAANL